jgi:hypothetical protein
MFINLLPVFLSFIYLINISYALVCPIYSPRKTNTSENRLIKTCHSNCSFSYVLENDNACLGVYYNYSGEILIKQLGIIHSDEQCSTSKQCILDIDVLNSQSFSCCCSTDNCTLNWKRTPLQTTTYRSILMNNTTIINTIIIEQEHSSWKLFLIIFISMMIIILITFTFSLWKSFRTIHENKDNTSFIKSPSLSLMEQLFFSAQQIIIGKNSTIYKAMFNEDIVALKVYNQTNILMWKNEVTLLRSIKHESIIKYVRFRRRKKQEYIAQSPGD